MYSTEEKSRLYWELSNVFHNPNITDTSLTVETAINLINTVLKDTQPRHRLSKRYGHLLEDIILNNIDRRAQ